MIGQDCWVELRDVCNQYGYAFWTAKRRMSKGVFPVRGYKVGKKWVIDREVHEEYLRRERDHFNREREAGLLALNTTNS